MVKMKLFVEGGGDTSLTQRPFRAGLSAFITKAGIKNRPQILFCGGRQAAYDDYCTAISNGEQAFLLVDSEEPVSPCHQKGQPEAWQPWLHLKQRNGDAWKKPAGAKDTECHLMVQVMETWFLADRRALTTFFGQYFNEKALPATGRSLESVSKQDIYSAIANATQRCEGKGEYGKGKHSSKLLEETDPGRVVAASPWADRFIKQIKKQMDS